MGHSYNNGLLTTTRGCAMHAFRVTFGASGAPTLSDKGKSGFLTVARTAQGRYTFTIAQPRPALVVAVIPSLSCVAADGAVVHARYVEGSYDATAGTFEIDTTADEDAPAAADPTSGTAMDVILVTQRLTNL